MRHVWPITSKELLQTRRDRLAALFTIVLPVIFTVFLGLLISGNDEEGDRLPLALADGDGTAVSHQLVERLEASPLVELQVMDVAEVDPAVQDQEVAAGLVIPEGFGTAVEAGRPASLSFVRIETSSGAHSILQAVQTAVSELNNSILAAKTAAEEASIRTGRLLDDALMASAHEFADAQLTDPVTTVIATNSGSSTERQASGFDQSSTGSLVNWVLFSLLTVAAGLSWERRQGLLRRLTVAGIRGREIIGGKMLAMVIITFLQQLLLVLLGQFAFGVDYFDSPLALLVTMLSLSVFASACGLLISSVFRSEQAVIATTVISAQLLAALGGAWFPLEITSASFSSVAHFLPTAWVMDSFHGIILKDWGIGQVLAPMGVVWIWIVVLFALAVWRFRPD